MTTLLDQIAKKVSQVLNTDPRCIPSYAWEYINPVAEDIITTMQSIPNWVTKIEASHNDMGWQVFINNYPYDPTARSHHGQGPTFFAALHCAIAMDDGPAGKCQGELGYGGQVEYVECEPSE